MGSILQLYLTHIILRYYLLPKSKFILCNPYFTCIFIFRSNVKP